ncbi:MAG: hypothetical protein LUB60_04075, partial [Clostridiales bacterium]|nr:hypothetical protein [Clostridiales bacterium]
MNGMEFTECVGRTISVSDLNVSVLLTGKRVKNREILIIYKGETEYRLEVFEVEGSTAFCIPLTNVSGLTRGLDVYTTGQALTIEYSDKILGRVYDSYGRPIDSLPAESERVRDVYDKNLTMADINIDGSPLWT